MREAWCWWSDELSLPAAAFQVLLTCRPNLTEQVSCSSFQPLLIKPPITWTSHADKYKETVPAKHSSQRDSCYYKEEQQLTDIPLYQLQGRGTALRTWSFFCSMLISEYSWAVASAAAKAFFFWLFARFGTEVVIGIGVWTILIGEFSGKSSN